MGSLHALFCTIEWALLPWGWLLLLIKNKQFSAPIRAIQSTGGTPNSSDVTSDTGHWNRPPTKNIYMYIYANSKSISYFPLHIHLYLPLLLLLLPLTFLNSGLFIYYSLLIWCWPDEQIAFLMFLTCWVTRKGRTEQERKATHKLKFASILFSNRWILYLSPEGEICVFNSQHTYKDIQKQRHTTLLQYADLYQSP